MKNRPAALLVLSVLATVALSPPVRADAQDTPAKLFDASLLPLAKADLGKAVDTLMGAVDTNHNGAYDPAEQLKNDQEAMKGPDGPEAIKGKMPHCASLGIAMPSESISALKESDYTPLTRAQLMDNASKAFTALDTDHDNVLSEKEVNAFENETQNIIETMNEKCKEFKQTSDKGDLPDPNIMMEIVTQMSSLNKRFAEK